MKITELNKMESFANILKIFGDSYLCENAKKIILQKLGVSDIAVSYFDDENFDVNGVVNACNQFSFFDEKRVVVVKNITKELSGSNRQIFINYQKNANINCFLLIINSKALDFVLGDSIDCTANADLAIKYITKKFAEKNKTAGADVCTYLASICLYDISKIDIEIKKICDYLGENNNVDKNIIDLLVTKDIELKVFDLTTALGQKNKNKSLSLLNDMLLLGEPPTKILGLIAGQFRRMMFAKINKGSNADLAKALGCKEFAITKAREQAGNFSALSLKKIEGLILDVDYSIKSGQMSQENAIYFLVLNILNIK